MSPECTSDTAIGTRRSWKMLKRSQGALATPERNDFAQSGSTTLEPQSALADESSLASAITRRIFSFPVMLAGMLTVLAVLTVRGRFNDPDMWWHLKTGEII